MLGKYVVGKVLNPFIVNVDEDEELSVYKDDVLYIFGKVEKKEYTSGVAYISFHPESKEALLVDSSMVDLTPELPLIK